MTKTIRNLILALAITAGTAGVAAAPAFADGWHHGYDRYDFDRDRHDDGWRWGEHDRVIYAAPPSAYYAAPAPVAAYAPPALYFGLNFR